MYRLYRQWLFMVIFLYDLHTCVWKQHSWSVYEMSYIHNRAVMNPSVKELQCVCLLTFSMLDRCQGTAFCSIFLFSPGNSLWVFIQIYIAYFLGKITKTSSFCHLLYLLRVLNQMVVIFSHFVAVCHILYCFILYCSNYTINGTVHLFCSVQQNAADISFGCFLKKPTYYHYCYPPVFLWYPLDMFQRNRTLSLPLVCTGLRKEDLRRN